MTRISEFVIDVNDSSVSQAIVNIGQYTAKAGQLEKSIGDVKRTLKLLETQGKLNSKEYDRQSVLLGLYTTEQKLNVAAIKTNMQTIQAHSKEAAVAKGSYANMKLQVQELTTALHKLDLSTEEGKKQFVEYRDQLQIVKGEVAYFEEALTSATAQGDMLSVQFGAAFKKIEDHVTDAGNTFKDLKGAVELMGIEALTKSMDGATSAVEKASKAYSGFQAVLKLGNSIIGAYKTITNAITSAKEAYKAGVSAATIVQRAFNTAVKLNPLGLIVGLVASAAAAFASYKLGADDATDSQNEFNQALRDAQELLNDSFDVNSMVQVIDQMNVSQIEKLKDKTVQQIEAINEKLILAKGLQKEIDKLNGEQRNTAIEQIKNPVIDNPSDNVNAPKVPIDLAKGKPDISVDASALNESRIAELTKKREALNIYELTEANKSYNASLNLINKTLVERNGEEENLGKQIKAHKDKVKELQTHQQNLNVDSEEYKAITYTIIVAKNELFALEEKRININKSNTTVNLNTETKKYANTVGGLTSQINSLIQAQGNLDLATEEGRQAFIKYEAEIIRTNQELQNQIDLAENLSLAAKPVSLKPIEYDSKLPEKVAVDDTKIVSRTDEIKGKAQEAADAFGKIGDALDIAEQISEARLQNELARIDEKRDAEIDAVNDSVLSEEQKKSQIEAINAKYDKEAEEKKKAAAKREKAFAITKTIIAGAQAVAQGIAQFGPPPSPPGIAAIAAATITTATQLALIAKQKFAKGGFIPFETGGMIQGAAHAQGGVPFLSGGNMMEAEGGELIVNRNIWRRPDFVKNISDMNALTGGKRFFAAGGMVPTVSPPSYVSTASAPTEGFDSDELVKGLRGVIADEVGSLRIVNNVVDTTSQQQRLLNIQTEASF